ncbi:hypothetical protein [Yinghuangia soli]|uniref:Uncharacterized protein n=1 Tax=Yinghuangia soli TaxID=2908204 RepID=A0AA41PW47_9ACTN|nr:hypothetical protein [Yinghuangia soli]MCF2526960.1 hypothetical protein [Yinghuangia soli]
MELRAELRPPAVPAERLAWLCAEIERIEAVIREGTDEEVEAALAAFNAETGHAFTELDLHEYWGACSVEELALCAARPARPRVPDITRDELVEILRRIMDGDPESDYYALILQTNVPNPRVLDLVFGRLPEELRDAGPEELLDAALAYRPIAL